MSTYLVAIFISDFKATSDNYIFKPIITVHTRPDQTDYTGTAIQWTRRILDALGNWTNIKYKELGIDKVDLVAIPHFPVGAMENWGLITME